MKNKLIFLFLLVANFAFAQLPCGVGAVSSVGATDKFMLCVGGNSKYATLFKIIDTTKTPYFPSGRASGYVKFDGTRWVSDNDVATETWVTSQNYLTFINPSTGINVTFNSTVAVDTTKVPYFPYGITGRIEGDTTKVLSASGKFVNNGSGGGDYIPITGSDSLSGAFLAKEISGERLIGIGSEYQNLIAFSSDTGRRFAEFSSFSPNGDFNSEFSFKSYNDKSVALISVFDVVNSKIKSISFATNVDGIQINGDGLKSDIYRSPKDSTYYVQKKYVDSLVAASGGGGGSVNSVTGTTNRITSTGGTDPVIDISSSYVGQSSIQTVGNISSGSWLGSPVADAYISSAATWNAKQAALVSGTNIKTVSGTSLLGSGDLGVIGSNYGGAGSINGVLKANGAGVVSAAVAGTDYVAPSDATYVKSVVLNTPNVLYTNPINFSTAANTATGTLSLNTQTAGQSFMSPEIGSVSATPTFRPIRQGDLISRYEKVGTVLPTDNFTSLTNWNTSLSGGAFSVASNELILTGGSTFTLSNYITSNYGSSNYEEIELRFTIRVGTISATSFGVGVGFQTASGGNRSQHVLIHLETGNVGKIEYFGKNVTTSLGRISTNGATLVAGDLVDVVVSMNKTKISTSLYTSGTGKQINNYTYTFPQDYPNYGDVTLGNTEPVGVYNYAIYACGGTHYLRNYTTISNSPKKCIVVLGDSMTDGVYATTSGNTWVEELERISGQKVVRYSGSGGGLTTMNIAEILALQPTIIINALGTNNTNLSTADFLTAYQAVMNPLISAGYVVGSTLFPCLLAPRNSISVVPYNAQITATYGTYINFYNAFTAAAATTIDPKYSPDGLHQNGLMCSIQAAIAYESIKNYIPYNPCQNTDFQKVNYQANGNVGISYGNGSSANYQLSVQGENATLKSQAYIGYVGETTGGYLFGNANGLLVGGNSAFVNGTHIAKGTSTAMFNCNSATGVQLLYTTGTTNGSTYSPVERLRADATGLHVNYLASNDVFHLPFTSVTANDGLHASATTGALSHIFTGANLVGGVTVAGNALVTGYVQANGYHAFTSSLGNSIGGTVTFTENARFSPSSVQYIGGYTADIASMVKGQVVYTGTAPTASAIDGYINYSGDRGGTAGKAGMHIRSEDGTTHVFSDLVGIGTATPKSKLHVVGGLRVDSLTSGIVRANGNGYLTTIASVGETQGGTAQTSYTTGDFLYASATNTLSKRAIGSTGDLLTVVAGVPAYESRTTVVQAIGDIRYAQVMQNEAAISTKSTAGDSTLKIYTIPANTLNVNGKGIEMEVPTTTTGGIYTSRFKVNGSTQYTNSIGNEVLFKIVFKRTSSTTATATMHLSYASGVQFKIYNLTGLDFTTTNTIEVSGEGGAASSISAYGSIVKYIPNK